ncbi:sensor histidine kinase [Hydrogenophaga sp. BPS33]|uniref:sensor histidine kinase n=1 Tax=Hydrogenophaga sp. BPS33 TaxID=2651974 RepID=UPI00131F6D7D|nr:HAMP domain-containing sensor histidine kinase [Hydrogenophaga sp. BPS33]QHE88198.1 HAMP domain-containing histidine kinase [Hydrogenophaga sp. BPS33]
MTLSVLQFFIDIRILSAILIAMLGATFLAYASARSWPYVKWLAGSAVLFGTTQCSIGSLVALGWLSDDAAGPVGSLLGLLAMAAMLAGLNASFSRQQKVSPLQVFLSVVVCAPLMVLAMSVLLNGWAFAGPMTIAAIFVATSIWLVSVWWRERWTGQIVLAVLFLGYPLLLVVAMATDMGLLNFRKLTPLPISIAYVFVMTLIQQRESKVIARELRERVKAEQALQQLTDSLEDSVRSRTQQLEEMVRGLRSFAGMVSHDLSGPLRNTAGLAEAALAEYHAGRPADAQHCLERIRIEAMRASTMVNNLLNLARVDHGPPELSPVDMQALVQECLGSLALQYPQAAQAVSAHPMPVVQAEASLMQHVVMNLVGNALKFGAGDGGLRVQLDVAREGPFWRFTVSDNGPGFDPAKSGELFQPFSRLDERKVGGTGLGLTVVKRVVEWHGGSVGAACEPGQGARFWWTLPAESGPMLPA